jgi:hypothetical protein
MVLAVIRSPEFEAGLKRFPPRATPASGHLGPGLNESACSKHSVAREFGPFRPIVIIRFAGLNHTHSNLDQWS